MISFPAAKINFGLLIIAKRIDGYHDIETAFYPIGLCDALEFVVPCEKLEKDILITSGIETASGDENIVLKTTVLLHSLYSFPFIKIQLHKAIPVGAGLGGGSSDSACLLKIINKFFSLRIPEEELRAISLEIGSDCPFFINCIPAIASGRGEILKPVECFLAGYYLVLLNPGFSISTREAYRNCTPEKKEISLLSLIEQPAEMWKDTIFNDFEKYAIGKYPMIGEMKEGLYHAGAIFSLMSGSGSSVYGIFREKPALPENLRKYKIFEGRL